MTSDFPDILIGAARGLLDDLQRRELRIATAESCTGGLIAGLLTEIPGSSAVFERGFVTYSNEAKVQMLGVKAALIDRHGAVSREVARAMAEGALHHSPADLAVAVTGIAGPDGGSAEKPVGLVHFAVAQRGSLTLDVERRFGPIGRHDVRMASVSEAIVLLHLSLQALNPV